MRSLAICFCCILLLFSVTTLGVSAKAFHGCAPSVPPSVAGTLTQPAAVKGLLFINEVLLIPHTIWNCSDSGLVNNSWVEIYNSQAQAFDLYGVHAALDNGPQTGIFYFPFGSAIAAHGFLVVFPQSNSPLFKSKPLRVRLLLNNIPVDDVIIPSLGRDQSYARVPDGSTTWQITNSPTIDASNISSSANSGNNGGTSSANTPTGSSRGTGTYSNSPDGVQPTWTTLHLPGTPDATPTYSSATPSTSSSTVNSGSPQADRLHKLLLSALVLALGLALWWCWKLSGK